MCFGPCWPVQTLRLTNLRFRLSTTFPTGLLYVPSIQKLAYLYNNGLVSVSVRTFLTLSFFIEFLF